MKLFFLEPQSRFWVAGIEFFFCVRDVPAFVLASAMLDGTAKGMSWFRLKLGNMNDFF